jgi:hypothetical protein
VARYYSRYCACSIFVALMLACLAGAPPAAAETVLRIADLSEPDSLDPHKAQLEQKNAQIRPPVGLTTKSNQVFAQPGSIRDPRQCSKNSGFHCRRIRNGPTHRPAMLQ